MNLDDEDFGIDKNSELYRLLKMLKDRETNSDDVEELREQALESLAGNTGLLGEPDSIDIYQEDGLTITVKIWNLLEGEVKNIDIEGDAESITQAELEDKVNQIIEAQGEEVKVVSLSINEEFRDENLEEQLEKAVLVEDYVLAAKLRDDIKERDNKEVIDLVNSTIEDMVSLVKNGQYSDAKILIDNIEEINKGTFKKE